MKKDVKSIASKTRGSKEASHEFNPKMYYGFYGAIFGGIIGIVIMIGIYLLNSFVASGSVVIWNGTKIVVPEQAQEWRTDKASILYESADSETGKVVVHYKNSAWATFTNDSLYLLQQYLAPKNKHGSLYDEVSGLPGFKEHGASAVYYAVNNDNGEFTELNKDVVYDAISAGLGTTNFTVFVEWDTNDGKPLGYANLEIGAEDPNMTDDHWFYQYQYKYADVSTFCTYTDSDGLFRSYVEYLKSNDLAKPSTDVDATGTEQEFSVDPSLYGSIVGSEESGTETTTVTGDDTATDDTAETTAVSDAEETGSETAVTEE